MKERSYTVAEIDRMREAISCEWLYGMKISKHRMRKGGTISRGYNEVERTKCVEEMLRTYMLAGVSPEELE